MQKRMVLEGREGVALSEYKKKTKKRGEWELSPSRKSAEWRQMLSDTY